MRGERWWRLPKARKLVAEVKGLGATRAPMVAYIDFSTAKPHCKRVPPGPARVPAPAVREQAHFKLRS
eukprot:8589101-Pyramimonas_sp.AAC.1